MGNGSAINIEYKWLYNKEAIFKYLSDIGVVILDKPEPQFTFTYHDVEHFYKTDAEVGNSGEIAYAAIGEDKGNTILLPLLVQNYYEFYYGLNNPQLLNDYNTEGPFPEQPIILIPVKIQVTYTDLSKSEKFTLEEELNYDLHLKYERSGPGL